MQVRQELKQQQLRKRKHDQRVKRWLLLCFPAGLLLMWSDQCHWSRAVKSTISLACVVLVLAVVLPLARPSDRRTNGIEIVSLASAVDIMGPTMKAGMQPYEIYTPKYIPTKSVLVEPTPTPIPYWVYCNDGGIYYHMKGCQFVKSNTPKVSLTQAVNAGFKRCKKCKAPKIEDIYGISY